MCNLHQGGYFFTGGMHNWMFGVGMMMILFVVLVVLGGWLFFSKGSSVATRSHKPDPLEILKTRLVKGEITEEEYLKLKDLL